VEKKRVQRKKNREEVNCRRWIAAKESSIKHLQVVGPGGSKVFVH
jgi:hypothetical protein